MEKKGSGTKELLLAEGGRVPSPPSYLGIYQDAIANNLKIAGSKLSKARKASHPSHSNQASGSKRGKNFFSLKNGCSKRVCLPVASVIIMIFPGIQNAMLFLNVCIGETVNTTGKDLHITLCGKGQISQFFGCT